MKSTISAVIPVYNVENYLKDCLDSIVDQKIPFYEVILVNDGSVDDSRRICEEYCSRYGFFTLINQKNAGPSGARNAGYRAAAGDYVVFIDSDDIVKSSMTQKLEKVLNDQKYDIVFYNAEVWYEERQGEPVNYFKRGGRFYGRSMNGMTYLSESFPKDYIISPWTAAYKRQFIKNNNIYFQEGIYFEDHDFCLRTYLKAKKMMCIDEMLYIRRCRNDSIMADLNSYKKCMDLIQATVTVWSIIEKSQMDILFQRSFAACYFINTWKVIRESDYYKAVNNKWKHLLAVFRDVWLDKFLSEDTAFAERLALFLFYNEQKRIYLKNIEEQKRVRGQIEKELIYRLNKIPLADASKKVGIYGIGKHTEKLLGLYKKYIGKIECGMFFIVTESNHDTADHKGHPLVVSDRIPKDTDCVVISSMVYQDDIEEQLKKNNTAEKRIVKLYGNQEFCDLTVIAKLLEECD